MRLLAYPLSTHPPDLVPARSNRAWMDATGQRFAYRCIPLGFANGSGWELLNPTPFAASWNGDSGTEAIKIYPVDGAPPPRLVTSHFGHGVLTFHTEYLFRTPPGWGVVVRGSPNRPKDGIAALEGLVETDWLPFPFTMNWLFTRPGTINFEAGEPFAFLTPTPHALLDGITPEVVPLSTNPGLEAEYKAWGESRANFNKALAEKHPEAVKQGWQRYYVKGTTATGDSAPAHHLSARKLNAPVATPNPAPLPGSLEETWAEVQAKGPRTPAD
ncbi:MAG: hypothetical protein INF43_01915 [Alphaproteobacteria bacterium]|nr:hypothetical protein [Alphaproteobacteria bacterium]